MGCCEWGEGILAALSAEAGFGAGATHQRQERFQLGAGVAVDFVLKTSDSPHRAIIDAAEELGCDVIVMASHGRRGINALLLGSETNKVLTHCKIPVLVCR